MEIFAELLDPSRTPPEFLRELREVLHEAAKRAGWRLPSAKAQLRQLAAASGLLCNVDRFCTREVTICPQTAPFDDPWRISLPFSREKKFP